MLKNYFKIAWRHLYRHRVYTILNTGGLAVGLTACMLIALWVRHETSYDAFHDEAQRLYRVVVDVEGPGGAVDQYSNTQPILGRTIRDEAAAPAVEEAIRFQYQSGLFQSTPGRAFYEGREGRHFILADPEALTAFSFPLRHGDPSTALNQPGSVVLSPAAANRYFPDVDNPIGRSLRRSNGDVLTVTGVFEAIPEASHLRPDLLVSMATYENDEHRWRSWSSLGLKTYVLLHEDASRETVQQQINQLFAERAGQDWAESGYAARYKLEPLTDVHLRSEYGGAGADGSITHVRIFALVAMFILLLAGVNYTNLATAQSVRRTKEIGVRRSVGAHSREVAAQFLTESVLLAGMAGIVALSLTRLLLPSFEQISGASLTFLSGSELFILMGATLATGLLAGAYPALHLARYRPADALRGTRGSSTSPRSVAFGRGLTVLQFAVAIGLIAATTVVVSQLHHMQHQDLGFQKDQMLVLNFGGDEAVRGRLTAVQERLERLPAVEQVTASSDYPGGDIFHSEALAFTDADGTERTAGAWLYHVDTSFASTYHMNLVAGQPMSQANLPDSSLAILLNEAAVTDLGLASPTQAIGLQTDLDGEIGHVVGVVADFHDTGLQSAIEPLALVEYPDNAAVLTLRLREGAGANEALQQIEAEWSQIAPALPFDYQFLDQTFEALYRSERRFARIFGIGAGLAIFIACLGLLGLAAFAVEERTREVGIRKALGASMSSIVGLLSSDFLRLVGFGFVVATPIVWFAMHRWLEDFAYRIELNPLIFAGAGIVAFLIAALTVSTQAIRAARTDPAQVLRRE